MPPRKRLVRQSAQVSAPRPRLEAAVGMPHGLRRLPSATARLGVPGRGPVPPHGTGLSRLRRIFRVAALGPVEEALVFLQKLEVHGFKSFLDRTEIRFGPGITCVVGPN